MRQVNPSWQSAVYVCTHERDPATGRAFCGLKRGSNLRIWLKDQIKDAGLKGDILVAKSGCLGVCSPLGTTVCFHPSADRGERSLVVFDHESDDRMSLWQALLKRVAPSKHQAR
jgi:predicted metal-binding protein